MEKKAPRGLGFPRMAAYPPEGTLVNNYSLLRLLWTLPCSHVLCLPRGEQEDWHLHNTMCGALVTGLKIGNHNSAGNRPGRVGEAAGGCHVSLLCGGIRTTGVSQEHSQAREGQKEVERDGIAQP